jgi:hypothetical protein
MTSIFCGNPIFTSIGENVSHKMITSMSTFLEDPGYTCEDIFIMRRVGTRELSEDVDLTFN